jgi:hypothetical protein
MRHGAWAMRGTAVRHGIVFASFAELVATLGTGVLLHRGRGVEVRFFAAADASDAEYDRMWARIEEWMDRVTDNLGGETAEAETALADARAMAKMCFSFGLYDGALLDLPAMVERLWAERPARATVASAPGKVTAAAYKKLYPSPTTAVSVEV